MSKTDYLIICGDFGGIWQNSKEDNNWLKCLNDAWTGIHNRENYDFYDGRRIFQ